MSEITFTKEYLKKLISAVDDQLNTEQIKALLKLIENRLEVKENLEKLQSK